MILDFRRAPYLFPMALSLAASVCMAQTIDEPAVKLLACSAKVVSITASEVVIEIAGRQASQRMSLTVGSKTQLGSAKPGDDVNVVYFKRSSKNFLVELIPLKPLMPGQPADPLGVAMLRSPVEGVQMLPEDPKTAALYAEARASLAVEGREAEKSEATQVAYQSETAAAQKTPTVAILDFDYAAVRRDVIAYFGKDEDVGSNISALIATDLGLKGKFIVVDRSATERILKEQDLSNSDGIDSGAAAKIGHVLGVDFVLVGDITRFGRDHGGSALGGGFGKIGLGGLKQNKTKAVVQVSARLVNANTGEIVAAIDGTGESTQTGSGAIGAAAGDASGAGQSADMSSSDFGRTALGEATNLAVAKLGRQLDDKATRLGSATSQPAATAAPK